jgi:hypothetical protein
MTSLTAERLYTLLPAVYRLRDRAQGEPLRALIEAFAQQFEALEENVEQLYDDQFIETCADWVAPYIGALVGYRPLHGVVPKVASPRAEVANTIAYRRRKGTALMLEQLAADVTGWPARAVEFFEMLATTQHMKHARPHAKATADLRDTAATFRVGGAFDSFAHTAEMRMPERGSGRYNIPNVGIFLWRLVPLRLSRVPLTPDRTDLSGRRFRLDPLGADVQLFRRSRTEPDISHLADPINVPEPLGVRLSALAIRRSLADPATPPNRAVDDDYGQGESLALYREGQSDPVPVEEIRIADLRDVFDGGGAFAGWNHEETLQPGQIGVDPERGRVLLGAPADGPLLATFHVGATRPMGGGEYERSPADVAPVAPQVTASDGAALQPLLDTLTAGGRLSVSDSLTYAAISALRVDAEPDEQAAGREVVVSAINGARPLLVAGGEIEVEIGARGRLVIDGLVVAGATLRLAAPASGSSPVELILRDCTLVPGLSLETDGSPASAGMPSLVVEHPFAKVTLERCILGPLRAVEDAEIEMQDCIVDAGAPDAIALCGLADEESGATLTARECTIVGKVRAREIALASNSIFFARMAPGDTSPGPIVADRRQQGCIRFSYVPAGSITPRRYRCVPDDDHPHALPHFTSLRYGAPAYGQLRAATDESIRSGADDGGEMGVLHALFQPQRETNLRIRLDEYLRFGLRAGIFYAS